MTFSGVASNFAGVPLALAFTFTLSQAGLVTVLLKELFGINIYQSGFTLFGRLGIEIVYMYFQFPLMVLIIAPAIDGLKKDWREAAEGMGASSGQYWRMVALPILFPSLLGTVILLFGNAFGAQATAYQLTGGTLALVPVVDRRPDQRRRPAQPRPGLRPGDGHGGHHGGLDHDLHAAPAAQRALAPLMTRIVALAVLVVTTVGCTCCSGWARPSDSSS